MPFQEEMVHRLGGSKHWFKLDLFKGFWLMSLSESCQEMFSFMTPDGVYTHERALQGAANSATQFQARMYEVFSDLLDNVEIWIHFLLGHAATPERWLEIMERVLQICSERNLLLNAEKCELFLKEAAFSTHLMESNKTHPEWKPYLVYHIQRQQKI